MIKYNLTALKRQPGARLKTTRGGLQVYSVVYSTGIAAIQFVHDQLTLGDSYTKLITSDPLFVGLLLEDKEMTFHEGDQASLALQWEGVTTETLPPAFWRIVRTPQEDPIDAHPDFESSIGGTAASPLNGAQFNAETGIFEGFPSTATSGLRGVTKYLAENIVVAKEYVTLTAPDDSFAIPILRTPVIDPADRGIQTIPSIPLGYNWMQTDLVYSRRGNVYEVSEEYTASGIGGWNSNIYDSY